MKRLRFRISVILLLIISSVVYQGCFEKNTDDPLETFTFWAGEKPSNQVSIIHGKYWESSHWSKEYIIYLELKASLLWRNEFIRQNNLVRSFDGHNIPSDAPAWFKPGKSLRFFQPSGFDQGSQYYEDTASGQVFIYEIVNSGECFYPIPDECLVPIPGEALPPLGMG